jgi:hypothetical protein
MGTINGKLYCVKEIDHFPDYLDFEPVVDPNYFDIARDEDMDAVEHWCRQHQCGKRTGHSRFFFETADQMTMFRLRWA